MLFISFKNLVVFCFQMFPLATVCGNTCILKPSERDPGATMMLMELAKEAGMPPGVVNVIHGKHDCKLVVPPIFDLFMTLSLVYLLLP